MASMFSSLARIGVCAAAVLLAGCSTLDVPRADNYPATGQKKARAVHHWDVLADDVAARIAAKLVDWPAGEHPIYLKVADASSFHQSFLSLLRVRLLDRGMTLSVVPTPIELEVQTQVVQHASGVPRSAAIPLPLTMLGTGVGVWRDWDTHYSDRTLLPGVATAIGLGVGVAMDLAQRHTRGDAAGGPTGTEVLVTTVLKNQDRYLTGSADMYYIERADVALYQPPPPEPPPAPVKTWKVVKP